MICTLPKTNEVKIIVKSVETTTTTVATVFDSSMDITQGNPGYPNLPSLGGGKQQSRTQNDVRLIFLVEMIVYNLDICIFFSNEIVCSFEPYLNSKIQKT